MQASAAARPAEAHHAQKSSIGLRPPDPGRPPQRRLIDIPIPSSRSATRTSRAKRRRCRVVHLPRFRGPLTFCGRTMLCSRGSSTEGWRVPPFERSRRLSRAPRRLKPGNDCQARRPARRAPGGPAGAFSASGAPGRLAAAFLVGAVEGGAGAVQGAGHEVAVDLVGDLDAVVAEPAGDLGDRDAFGQGGGGIQVAQRVRYELRRQARSGGGPLEVLLVAAADDELVLAALEQVPVD